MTRKTPLVFGAIMAITTLASLVVASDDRTRLSVCSLTMSTGLDRFTGISFMPKLGDRSNNFTYVMHLEQLSLELDFDVSVPMIFYDDHESPNACYHPGASKQILRKLGLDPGLYNDQGIVLIGKSLIMNERSEGRGYGVSAILAHEYAHAAQAKRHCGLTGKWRELHADYMAGWFCARQNHVMHNQDMAGLFAIFDKGDFSFGSSTHHGTPKERGKAFLAGYLLHKKDSNSSNVYSHGFTFIDTMKRW